MAKEENKINYSLTLKLRTDKSKSFFGPGVVELMNFIKETDSLNRAAKKMGMSYNKAWRILKKAEEEVGYPLVIKSVGGSNGGGSSVTEEGQKLLDRYVAFEEKMYETAEKYFVEFFGE